MLKPNDRWNWYFSEREGYLMLDLGCESSFQTQLTRRTLVNCAFTPNVFSIEDAILYQQYQECIAVLDLAANKKEELLLNCVAAKRFYKPVQPKSWYFQHTNNETAPYEGQMIYLFNQYQQVQFMVLDVGDIASLCIVVDEAGFMLDEHKVLGFSQLIKVMHNRMLWADCVETPLLKQVNLVG